MDLLDPYAILTYINTSIYESIFICDECMDLLDPYAILTYINTSIYESKFICDVYFILYQTETDI